jgi:hypothetical protein
MGEVLNIHDYFRGEIGCLGKKKWGWNFFEIFELESGSDA